MAAIGVEFARHSWLKEIFGNTFLGIVSGKVMEQPGTVRPVAL